MKYRKKPIVVEAVRVDETLKNVRDWSNLPAWVIDAYEEGTLLFLNDAIEIRTLEGTMRGAMDDWIIRGISGEVYPCKPDIFQATYEPIAEESGTT